MCVTNAQNSLLSSLISLKYPWCLSGLSTRENTIWDGVQLKGDGAASSNKQQQNRVQRAAVIFGDGNVRLDYFIEMKIDGTVDVASTWANWES